MNIVPTRIFHCYDDNFSCQSRTISLHLCTLHCIYHTVNYYLFAGMLSQMTLATRTTLTLVMDWVNQHAQILWWVECESYLEAFTEWKEDNWKWEREGERRELKMQRAKLFSVLFWAACLYYFALYLWVGLPDSWRWFTIWLWSNQYWRISLWWEQSFCIFEIYRRTGWEVSFL